MLSDQQIDVFVLIVSQFYETGACQKVARVVSGRCDSNPQLVLNGDGVVDSAEL
jgi:hypothetical protein